jgi:hypothetical protein
MLLRVVRTEEVFGESALIPTDRTASAAKDNGGKHARPVSSGGLGCENVVQL